MLDYGYTPNMVNQSRFDRRRHRVANLFASMFSLPGKILKEQRSLSSR
jgi:hypothetical protein